MEQKSNFVWGMILKSFKYRILLEILRNVNLTRVHGEFDLPVTSHIALSRRTMKTVSRLKYRQLVSLMVLWLTLLWLRWFSCLTCDIRLRPVKIIIENKEDYFSCFTRVSTSISKSLSIFPPLTSKSEIQRNNGLNSQFEHNRWLKQIITEWCTFRYWGKWK